MNTIYEQGDVVIRESERYDVDLLKDNLKPADVAEIWAAHRQTPEEALQNGFDISIEKYTLLYQGEVVAMFGINPESLLSFRAVAWLLTSDRISEIPVSFLRLSKIMIKKFLKRYPILYNAIDSRHRTAISWIRWCGAEIFPPVHGGYDNATFHPFVFGGR